MTDGALNFQNVDKAWVYDANGAFVQYLVAPTALRQCSRKGRLPREDAAGQRNPLTEGSG